jgi:hypothetical protein
MLHWTAIVVALFFGGHVEEFSSGNPWLKVEISMADDGFMCPFLTPMFIGVLEDKGADWVVCRPQESEIAFCVPLEFAQSQEGYTDWLEKLGYQRHQVSFLQFDTLSVQPQVPTP